MNNNNNNNGTNAMMSNTGNGGQRDTILMAQEMIREPTIKKLSEYTSNTWIADTGASCHITNDETGLYDVEYLKDDYITVAVDHEI